MIKRSSDNGTKDDNDCQVNRPQMGAKWGTKVIG